MNKILEQIKTVQELEQTALVANTTKSGVGGIDMSKYRHAVVKALVQKHADDGAAGLPHMITVSLYESAYEDMGTKSIITDSVKTASLVSESDTLVEFELKDQALGKNESQRYLQGNVVCATATNANILIEVAGARYEKV